MSKIISVTSNQVFQSINDRVCVSVPSTATDVSIDYSIDGTTWEDVEDYDGSGNANIACAEGQYFKVTFGGVTSLNVLL